MTSLTTSDRKFLVLITGASGFVGSAVALEFLRLGHSVRLPLRRQEQIDAWKATNGKGFEGKVDYTLLEGDMWIPGVFDEAIKGVDAVAHVASAGPMIKTDAETDILKPAIDGTLSILESAKKASSVKAVAVTSSVGAYASIPDLSAKSGIVLNEKSWNSTTYEEAAACKPEMGYVAYLASKGLAEEAALDFAKQPDVHFSLSTHAPALILGWNHDPSYTSPDKARSSIQVALQHIWNKKTLASDEFVPVRSLPLSDFVLVQAVAHPLLLCTGPSGKRYLLIGAKASWERIIRCMIKTHPQLKNHLPAVSEEVGVGENKEAKYEIEAGRYERDFGNGYEDFEKTVEAFGKQLYQVAEAGGQV
ncbi:hypothetical protein JCM11641_006597 [Rhodosporidiobolus odoratus]